MRKNMASEDILIKEMLNRNTNIRLERCFFNINEIFKRAFRKERRLLAVFDSYEYVISPDSLLPIAKKYDLSIKYRNDIPENINDIIVDLQNFDIKNILGKNCPKSVIVITNDIDSLQKKLNKKANYVISSFEGIRGWQISYWGVEFSEDYCAVISFQYMLSENDMRSMTAKASLESKKIWRKILGNAVVPDFIKTFLALSYLTQECIYDEAAFKEVARNQHAIPKDPIVHLSYGPLVDKRGICSGLAWAYKRLMEEAGIECICVGGYLREDQSTGHMWNLVKLDGQYYHVDPTSGIKNNGVYVSELLQPDNIYKATHIWNINDYPVAKGIKYDYETIEDYLVEYGNDYLDEGADEKYMFPDNIVD